ncbi:pyridoxine 5'-phosphate synthase [candidate division WOR-3 bacterium 4484_100]|uniref:Pyridoxine 5'-phosphate synthase n=1 Tax=candidate division WOR-3 bacterium 4484_100 TaxID=1936077 RepID=A0A1V4QEB0_UNCW3|nr:MAG: pyridoxine 5'-phosphate synthase [candidate division WOR-3 bacterium 4484_100]
MELSVNIDHIATLREARKELFPDPVYAAVEAELGGADGITVHLRGDRRHIKERDLELLRKVIKTELNLEMAATKEMAQIALKVKPDRITLVPESPGEVTTQGGLDLLNLKENLKPYIANLQENGIKVGLFLDPDPEQIKEAVRSGVQYIEINTNEFSKNPKSRDELIKIARVAKAARREGLTVHAGHGIDYKNIKGLLTLSEITSFSIGFAIIARAVFVGLRQAVNEMIGIIKGAR